MPKKKIIGFQSDTLTDNILKLKQQEAKALGEEFNVSKFIRDLIHATILEADRLS